MSADTEPGSGSNTTEPTRSAPRWWRWVGLRRRAGKRLPIGLTRWGWVLLIVLVGGVAMGGFAEYSMQPDFCRSCHIMEPYYQAWHTSTHKNVPCADCHFEPGLRNTLKGKFQASSQAVKYITQTYGSKPHAEIRDASCMREGCHERRVLEGKVNWDVPTQRGGKVTIRFDHTPHLQSERRGKQLRCVSCHSQIVQGQHLVVTLDTCFLCHMKDVKHGRDDQTLGGCTSCHEAPSQEVRLTTGVFNHSEYSGKGVSCQNCHSEVVRGDGSVPRQVCWTCHNQPKQVARFSETQFLHTAHVTEHKVECGSCHLQIEHNLSASATGSRKHTASALAESGSCGQCHEQMHGGPESLYRGTGGRGVPDMPSPMSRAQVDCIACHDHREVPGQAAQVIGQTYVAAQDRCDHCHKEKYRGTLEEWRKTIAQNVDRAEIAYDQARRALENSKLEGMARLSAQRLLDDAAHNIRLVKLGHGVHNVNYSTALLNAASENARRVGEMVQQGAAASTGGP